MKRIKRNFKKIVGLALLAMLFTAVALPTLAAPTAQVACTAPAWAPGEIYVGGDVVSHNGHEWRAKWWTTNEEPGTTGQYGVWEDLGSDMLHILELQEVTEGWISNFKLVNLHDRSIGIRLRFCFV